jgi:hypothetical protein
MLKVIIWTLHLQCFQRYWDGRDHFRDVVLETEIGNLRYFISFLFVVAD